MLSYSHLQYITLTTWFSPVAVLSQVSKQVRPPVVSTVLATDHVRGVRVVSQTGPFSDQDLILLSVQVPTAEKWSGTLSIPTLFLISSHASVLRC